MKNFFLFLPMILLMAACGKSDDCKTVTVQAPASEIAILKTFLDTNHIVTTADSRGFFYHIDAAGSGTKPTACKNITIGYAGYFLNGTSFDQNPNATFDLGNLITCWQEALPLLSQGGTMSLYVPPSLGYGANANGPIPANSYLKFVITLKGIN